MEVLHEIITHNYTAIKKWYWMPWIVDRKSAHHNLPAVSLMYTVSLHCGCLAISWCITVLPSALYSHLRVKPWNMSRISWHCKTITTWQIKINTWKTVCGGPKTISPNTINKQAHVPLTGWPQFIAGCKEASHIGNNIHLKEDERVQFISTQELYEVITLQVNAVSKNLDQTGWRCLQVRLRSHSRVLWVG